MENRKVLVIYANCMGACIFNLLKKKHSHEFFLYYFSNFEIIYNKMCIPEKLKEADIFLYQNYSERNDEYNLETIINTHLKPTCQKVCFPTLHSCNLLFGYDTNIGTLRDPKPELPFGYFFYGIKDIYESVKNEKKKIKDDNDIILKIIEDSKKDDFISKEQIDFFKNRTFEFLENKTSESDFPEILIFIKNNYKTKRLWSNPNHPTNILTNELVKLVCQKINLSYDDNEGIIFFENMLNDWEMPIFQSVKNHLELEFDCEPCSSWYFSQITDRTTYLTTYISEVLKTFEN